MTNEQLISAEEFCMHHNIEISFIKSLNEYGLIHTTTVEQKYFINENDLRQLEKFIHFYYDMDINLEGIEAIHNLLEKMNSMQNELMTLKNKLMMFDEDDRMIVH